MKIVFRAATSSDEMQQIHRLNHAVFADEIGQHQRQPSGLLVDRLHEGNRYFIALRGDQVIGMISVNAGPEFSIRKRLKETQRLRDFARPLEVRLLAIAVPERNRTVLAGLLWQVFAFARANDFSHLLISGIAQREQLYRKLGFVPLGPPVPDGAAMFFPMVMAMKDPPESVCDRVRRHQRRREGGC